MNPNEQRPYMEPCKHVYDALGFEVVEKTKEGFLAVAALFCKQCGLFRTKMLQFDKDKVNEFEHRSTRQ